ncbi:MAG TPA: SRPBCC domain-containing protein [Candidatus Saccharimonadia bacterium]|jgi:uncharacterized protein YndB with AHSA1/START domain|nr:SRPBCC domain-containing protein [Candidatus Saccharimonadia bacterium]
MAEAQKFDIVINRIVDAPLDLVWRAWTEPEHIMKWWGPQDFTSPSATVDLHEGGRFVFAMEAPAYQGGGVSYTAGTYKKIVKHERLEFTQGLSDADGKAIDPASVGMPADFPAEIETVIEFRRIRPDMTELVITERGWTPGQMMVFSYAGMHQSIDKLGASLK